MRILKTILVSLAAASLSPIAQARVIDKSATYTNPETIPVLLLWPYVVTTYDADYHGLPSSLDFRDSYKEYTSPGPVITYTLNTPTTLSYGANVPNTIKLQTWVIDPTPDNFVDNDNNLVEDKDDTRLLRQTLDLNEHTSISSLISNSVGYKDIITPAIPGSIFWNTIIYNNEPVGVECGHFTLDGDTSHVTKAGNSWNTPRFSEPSCEEGSLGLVYNTTIRAYSMIFSTKNNTEFFGGYVTTIGKVTEGLELLKAITSSSGTYELATDRTVSASFSHMPLWNTYTNEEYDAFKQPAQSDFIRFVSATISDPTGVDPSHGLKFVEDFPFDSNTTDDKNDLTDPNAAIKKVFNVSLSEDGIFTFKLRDDVPLSSAVMNTYTFAFRVYVNDGTNNGKDGTDYYLTQAYIYVRHPFVYYAGDATKSSSVDYSPTKDGSNVWYWYKSNAYGWLLVKDFPDNRWVYSYEHGWIYMDGDMISSKEGVFWYNTVSSWGTDKTPTDDEVGWVWTNAEMYPYLYSFKDGGWVYYIKDVDKDSTDDKEAGDYKERILDQRLFWSYRQNAYISPSGADTTYDAKPFKINGKKFGTGF
jgi:hypothetical protein